MINTLTATFAEQKRSKLIAYKIRDDFSFVLANDLNTDGALEVDVILSESLNFKKSVTSFPVETGETNTSDNAVIDPVEISLDCVVSENPMYFSEYNERLKATLSKEEMVNFYRAQVMAFVAVVMQPDILLAIEVSLGYFINLSVTNISFKADASSVGALKFSMSLKEIDFVYSATSEMLEFGQYKPTAIFADKVGKKGKGKNGISNPIADMLAEIKKRINEKPKGGKDSSIFYSLMIRLIEAITGSQPTAPGE